MYIPFGFEANIGGCITAVGGDTIGTFVSGGITYKYHQFSQAGTSSFQVLNGSVNNASILLIAAGGAGGSGSVANTSFGGGGGAGEVFYTSSVLLTSGSVYQIKVGNGLINNGTRGQDSAINGSGLSNITVLGGGFGGQRLSVNGKNGGSGGGGNGAGSSGGSHIGSYIGTNGEGGYTVGVGTYGGGGGGAGQAGGVRGQGRGGNGLIFNMTGDERYYAGGAGGSITSGSAPQDGEGQEWFGGGGGGAVTTGAGNRGKNGCCIITYPYSIDCQSQNIPIDVVRSGLIVYNTTSSFSGSVWYDQSGNGNNALVSGSTMYSSGSLGWEFNGIDNFITYPQPILFSSASIAPSNYYTLQWYGSMYNDGINRFLFTKKASNGSGWDTIWDANQTRIVYRGGGADDKQITIVGSVSEKALWTLIVYDAPNIITNTVSLYKNGSYVGDLNSGDTQVFNHSTITPLRFGYDETLDATYFKGAISSLLVYNRPLSQVEINNNYLYLSSL